jgi:dTDP-glucose pyrophosphorylase
MFIFPMLGRSSRFISAGYAQPKYKLPLGINSEIVFDHVLRSFVNYFEKDLFILICRSDSKDKQFLIERLQALGVKNFNVIEHDGETRGQAESVDLALKGLPDEEELFIFNIDTILYNFKKESKRNTLGGYLEVFRGEGSHWSFVEPSKLNLERVIKVVEKERISDLCSNGLYYFNSVRLFKFALTAFKNNNQNLQDELYIAPLYNELINMGLNVNFKIIQANDIGFCGVPLEYENLLLNYV